MTNDAGRVISCKVGFFVIRASVFVILSSFFRHSSLPPNIRSIPRSEPILTRHYGTANGPLGFPMLDRQAFALDAILKALPNEDAYAYRKSVVAEKASEVLPGERSDVSWITTEDPDRTKEVV